MRRVRALLIAFGTDARNAGIELIPALICFGLAEPNCKDRCRQAEKVKLMRGENEAHEFRASLTRPGGQGFRAGERNKRKHWVGTGIRRRSCAMHPDSRQADAVGAGNLEMDWKRRTERTCTRRTARHVGAAEDAPSRESIER